MKSKTLVLGLHRVGYPPKSAKIKGLFVTPRLLSFELWLLRKLGYQFVTLKDALLNPSERNAVITFDDGYEDNFTAGLPVLARHGVPATIFVITGDVGKKNVVWEEAGEKLPADMVTWEMLADFQSRGWEIGSHGHRHEHLDLQAADSQAASIRSSLDAIEGRLGTVPISFAYPYGVFDESTKEALRQLGIRFAVTTAAPMPQDLIVQDDHLELKRVPIGGRRFDHYIRCVSRTVKAIGFGEVLVSLLPTGVRRSIAEETPESNAGSV
jgi:peptidoglycan/xylan/chitin deacetylase (PgdA/CDA1 family)